MNSQSSSGSGFLNNALFFGAGSHFGNKFGDHNSYSSNRQRRRQWDDQEDHNWRATTKAPYFGNKVPGSEVILPAAAVVGAATAFGLVSLLPLNVPINKPLMYCKKETEDLAQAKILINDIVYECYENEIIMTDFDCFKVFARNSNPRTKRGVCLGDQTPLQCGFEENIHCIDQTLLSRSNVYCNSTTKVFEQELINCYEGKLDTKKSSFIPTPKKNMEENSFSLAAQIHIFLLKMLGKGEIFQKPEPSDDDWLPEALTIRPETETTTQKMIWVSDYYKGRSIRRDYRAAPNSMQIYLDRVYERNENDELFQLYTKIYSTTETNEN
jgi:hypothetical protein